MANNDSEHDDANATMETVFLSRLEIPIFNRFGKMSILSTFIDSKLLMEGLRDERIATQ